MKIYECKHTRRSIISLLGLIAIFVVSGIYAKTWYPPSDTQNYISLFSQSSKDQKQLIWVASKWPTHTVIGVHGERFENGSVYAEDQRSPPPYRLLSPKDLYEEIKDTVGDKPILMMMCHSSHGNQSFAQRLSVMAPNEIIATPEYFSVGQFGGIATAASFVQSLVDIDRSRVYFDVFKNGIQTHSFRRQ